MPDLSSTQCRNIAMVPMPRPRCRPLGYRSAGYPLVLGATWGSSRVSHRSRRLLRLGAVSGWGRWRPAVMGV